jgi:pyridinium-3,5-biscarboxylic acid mononucleotide synthase
LNPETLSRLLEDVRRGDVSVEEAARRLRILPFEDIGVACVDHHRSLRRGAPEILFGQGKDVSQMLSIMASMCGQNENIMITRLSAEKAERIREKYPDAIYHQQAGVLTLLNHPIALKGRGTILVISAGTSDIPVAEEAAETARFLGNEVETLYDLGVCGLHRVLQHFDKLTKAAVLIVVAGMEGALPSVVGGLVDKPVIAVPTSVGYGASFQGVAALLGMLNSCASGVTVVNIDNGFGAAYAASLINR